MLAIWGDGGLSVPRTLEVCTAMKAFKEERESELITETGSGQSPILCTRSVNFLGSSSLDAALLPEVGL